MSANKTIRLTHLQQLAFYLKRARECGLYYGNKEQFNKRHADLEKWLFDLIEAQESAA